MRLSIPCLILALLIAACGPGEPTDGPPRQGANEPAGTTPAPDEPTTPAPDEPTTPAPDVPTAPTPAPDKPATPDLDLAALIADLEGTDLMARLEATFALGALGAGAAPAIPALETLLRDADPDMAVLAAHTLAKLVPDVDAALPALTRGLEDEKCARAALAGLMVIGVQAKFDSSAPRLPATVVAAIVAILDSTNDDLREFAALTLGTIGDVGTDAERKLAGLLTAEGLELRAEAAWALARIGSRDDSVLDALLLATKDEDPDVSAAAACAIREGPGTPEAAVRALCRAATDGKMRKAAVEALGAMGPAAAAGVDTAIALLESDDMDLRGAAVDALGRIGNADARVLAALTKALNEKGRAYPVPAGAAWALGMLGAKAAPATRALALHLGESQRGYSAREGLKQIGTAAVPELRKMAKDDTLSPDLRERTAKLADEIEAKAGKK